MEKLALTDNPKEIHQPPKQGGHQLQKQSGAHQLPLQASVTDNSSPFKLMDRVMVFDVNGVPEEGTVKWIGRNKKLLPNGAYIVGIHSVSV